MEVKIKLSWEFTCYELHDEFVNYLLQRKGAA